MEIEYWNGLALIKEDEYFTKWIKQCNRLDHHVGFLNFIQPFLGGEMLDIGANIGTHSIFYAQFGHVHCFEPHPTAFECLKYNLEGQEATLYNLAVGETEHCVNLHTPSQNNPGYSYTVPGDDIPVIAIDSLNLDRCNFIKIDVEGDELAVLRGAARTIRKHKPTMIIECNPTTLMTKNLLTADLINFIHTLGYTCNQHVPRTTCELLCQPL